MAFTKITQADLESRGATTLPNQPTISASLLKQEFDAPAKEIVAPAFNNLIDELEADTAADSLGVSMPEGRTGDSTIQGAIDSISVDLGTAEGKVTELEELKHSHSNKATIDKFSEASDKLYWNGSPVGGGGGTGDYVDLENKPQINSVTLIGNMSAHDLGLATESALANKVDKETDKGLSSNDYTDGEKADVAKIDTIEGNVGTLTSSVGIVQGKITTLEGQMLGVQDGLNNKVDKVAGKGLSTKDYTNEDKAKVDSLGTASTKNSTSVVTESSDLVESGAVYDAIESAYQLTKDSVGWSGKNLWSDELDNAVTAKSGTTYTLADNVYTINCDTTDYSGIYWSAVNTRPLLADKAGIKAILSFDIKASASMTGVIGFSETVALTTEYQHYEHEINDLSQIGPIVFYSRDTSNARVITVKNMMIYRADIIDNTYQPYHKSVSDSLDDKCDNYVIGTVEDGANPTKSYAVGEHMLRGGKFCTVTVPVTTSSTWTLGGNYVEGDVASEFEKYYHGAKLSISDLNNLPLGMGYAEFTGAATPTTGYSLSASFICFGNTQDKTVMVYRIGNIGMYVNRYYQGSWSGWALFTGTVVS